MTQWTFSQNEAGFPFPDRKRHWRGHAHTNLFQFFLQIPCPASFEFMSQRVSVHLWKKSGNRHQAALGWSLWWSSWPGVGRGTPAEGPPLYVSYISVLLDTFVRRNDIKNTRHTITKIEVWSSWSLVLVSGTSRQIVCQGFKGAGSRGSEVGSLDLGDIRQDHRSKESPTGVAEIWIKLGLERANYLSIMKRNLGSDKNFF